MRSSNTRKHRNILQSQINDVQPYQFEEETQPLQENANSNQNFFDYSKRIETIDKFLQEIQSLKQMSFYKN
ncbi:unnamed protein product [Paramecium pentaurelia]|uniref:Uncharacterized protein n=1 Tax=Paramecium pentaurelia TaxID=43138 RepID=A0A8S1WMI8_9CILI|nr:unnamed protein product [Paramecium pentaurelia]